MGLSGYWRYPETFESEFKAITFMKGGLMKFLMTLVIIPIIVSACATYPSSREEQATYHANEAKLAIAKNDCHNAAYEIEKAISRPTGYDKIKNLFANCQECSDCYTLYFKKAIDSVSNSDEAFSLHEKLTVTKSKKIFTDTQIDELFARLNKEVIEKNSNGKIQFNLNEKIDCFPELNSPAHQKLIIDNAIKKLQVGSSENRPVGELIDYAQRVGVNSPEWERINSLLPTMNIRRDELDALAKVFPEFATVRREEITARLFLQVKNGDRLFKDDIVETFHSRIHGVEFSPNATPETITLVVEQVRYNEKTLPTHTQTITYAKHELNTMAVLLLPRNASYLYDVVTGGAEIEYGFVISAIKNGKIIHDGVIRGKVGGECRQCQNKRIQNVFGGVSSANFIANEDMQQRCSGPETMSMDDLRKEIFSKIVDEVLKVPSIKLAHEYN